MLLTRNKERSILAHLNRDWNESESQSEIDLNLLPSVDLNRLPSIDLNADQNQMGQEINPVSLNLDEPIPPPDFVDEINSFLSQDPSPFQRDFWNYWNTLFRQHREDLDARDLF